MTQTLNESVTRLGEWAAGTGKPTPGRFDARDREALKVVLDRLAWLERQLVVPALPTNAEDEAVVDRLVAANTPKDSHVIPLGPRGAVTSSPAPSPPKESPR